jgi:hypothetical protein
MRRRPANSNALRVRSQFLAGFIEEQTGEQMRLRDFGLASPPQRLRGEGCLGRLECGRRDDRLALSFVDLILVPDLADVDRLRKQVVKVAATKRHGDCN